MPKDNIERAVKKGTGEGSEVAYEEILYEGYGPGGVAILIETLTDNKNRTVGEVRYALGKHGGNLGASGCVSFLFEKKGVLVFERGPVDADALLEGALEAGAEDVVDGPETVEVVTTPPTFESVRDALSQRGFSTDNAQILMNPTSTTKLEGSAAQEVLRLSEALEDRDDVQNVYANFDISDEEMAKFV